MPNSATASKTTGSFNFLISCEHGGNRIPACYASLFDGAEQLLESHRGWDPGALEAARYLARQLEAPLVEARISRLLVDLNRSRRLFSEITGQLSPREKRHIIEQYYEPHYRQLLEYTRQPTIHLAIHSFTPILNDELRNTTVGLLYDPSRRPEKDFALQLQRNLTGVRTRRNYPYRGISDGLPTRLRKELPADRYLGLEIELNQAVWFSGSDQWTALLDKIVVAIINAAISGTYLRQ